MSVDPARDPQRRDPADPARQPKRRVPHRTPRYGVFIGTGVLVGLVAAAVLTWSGDPGARFGYGAVFGYLGAFLSLLGALAGGAVAVAVEALVNRGRRGRARSPRT